MDKFEDGYEENLEDAGKAINAAVTEHGRGIMYVVMIGLWVAAFFILCGGKG